MAAKKSRNSNKTNDIDPDSSEENLEEDILSEDDVSLEDPDDDGADDAEEFSVESTFSPELMELHKEVETALFAQDAPQNGVFATAEAFQGAGNIMGVGLGSAEVDNDQISDDGPGTPVLNIYVAEPCTMEDARRSVVDSFGVRAISKDSNPVNVICTGVIDALAHRHKDRPSPNGISIGHKDITAGTQGALARGCRGNRRRRVLILSNNHVLANTNAGRAGDSILQPGPHDGGRNTRDRVAVLERFVPIKFGASDINYVDCATGWAWHRRVRKEYTYRAGNRWRYFNVNNQTRGCDVGMRVGKSGRTTQLTNGRVTDCRASIRVNFGGGRVANFRDQIAIRGNNGNFSAGGDSGSVIWTWDRRRNPVGLLFAGGGGVTFANKISRVLTALDIRLDI